MDDPFDFDDLDFDAAASGSGSPFGPSLTLEDAKPPRSGADRTRLYNIVSIVFVVLTGLALVFAILIGLNPNAAFNPLPPDAGGGAVAELPTPFVIPTQPPTYTAQPESGFPTADLSATVVFGGEGTSTPEGGDTGALEPTADVLGTLTAQPQITATVDTGQPTSAATIQAPAAYPFELQDGSPAFNQNPNSNGGCNFAGVAGQVFDLNGDPLIAIAVRVVGENFDSLVYSGTEVDYGESGYEILLNTSPLEAEFEIQLFTPSGQPLTEKIVFRTRGTCEENVILLNFVQVASY